MKLPIEIDGGSASQIEIPCFVCAPSHVAPTEGNPLGLAFQRHVVRPSEHGPVVELEIHGQMVRVTFALQ